MADSVYKVIELIGTSTESWEKAAAVAVERVAEVVELDMVIDVGKITAYRWCLLNHRVGHEQLRQMR